MLTGLKSTLLIPPATLIFIGSLMIIFFWAGILFVIVPAMCLVDDRLRQRAIRTLPPQNARWSERASFRQQFHN